MSIQVDSSNPLQTLLVINGVSVLKLNQDGSVELPNAPVGTSGSRLLTAAQTPFTKVFTSAEQTITIGGSLTIAHGFSESPDLVVLKLVCKSADAGWAIGDELFLPTGVDITGTSAHGVGVSPDATNINIRFSANTVVVHNKATGAGANIVPANWRLVVRAYA